MSLSELESLRRRLAGSERDVKTLLAALNEITIMLGYELDAVSPQDVPGLVASALQLAGDRSQEGD